MRRRHRLDAHRCPGGRRLDPDVAAAYLDRPAYRAQRVLYPLLASIGGLAGDRELEWALLGVNLAAVALGTYAAGQLAALLDAPSRASLAFALNPAVLLGLLYDTSDVLAIALVMAALLANYRKRPAAAGIWFGLAALAKEVMLLVPLAIAAHQLVRNGRAGWKRLLPLVGPGSVAVAGWAIYVRTRLGWTPTQIEELAAPLTGFRDAWRHTWVPFDEWGQAIVVTVLLAGLVIGSVMFIRRRSDLLAGVLPFALLFPFLSAQVLGLATNSVRAVGPAMTLVGLGLYARR